MNGVRVLERDGGVRVVEAAAVRPELLDRDLRGDRAARDRLLRALERRGGRRAVERLDDAPGDEHDREHRSRAAAGCRRATGRGRPRSSRASLVERRAKPRMTAASTAIPSAGRDEVLHREPGHLAQVRHRVLAAVVLPVRVRDEARRRVHRDVRVRRSGRPSGFSGRCPGGAAAGRAGARRRP